MRGVLLIAAMAAMLGSVGAQQPVAPAPALDFAFFRARVQPIFRYKRPGLARCYSCHSQGTPLQLRRRSPGSDSWNEEESRKNFEAVRSVVVPGNPQGSCLLMMPLAAEAGGVDFHPGGKHWSSQDDAEWRTLAEWSAGRNRQPAGPKNRPCLAT